MKIRMAKKINKIVVNYLDCKSDYQPYDYNQQLKSYKIIIRKDSYHMKMRVYNNVNLYWLCNKNK